MNPTICCLDDVEEAGRLPIDIVIVRKSLDGNNLYERVVSSAFPSAGNPDYVLWARPRIMIAFADQVVCCMRQYAPWIVASPLSAGITSLYLHGASVPLRHSLLT